MNISYKYNEIQELPTLINTGNSIHVIAYSVLMLISATGNLTVLFQLVRRVRKNQASRLDLLLIHLSVADLLVTFFMIPLEIAWSVSGDWKAGDFACRLLMFTRVFGLYLSSFVVICIAIDRYFIIIKPMNTSWEPRIRRDLTIAWVCAFLASMPQSFIFHVEEHPDLKRYYQCVTHSSLPTMLHEVAYFAMNMMLLYVAPLITTVVCSTAVLLELHQKSKACDGNMRRSGVGVLERAKTTTMKLSVTIVTVFFVCWSPYYAFCVWSLLELESRAAIPIVQGVQCTRAPRSQGRRQGMTILLGHHRQQPYSEELDRQRVGEAIESHVNKRINDFRLHQLLRQPYRIWNIQSETITKKSR